MSYQFKNVSVLVVESSEQMFSLTRDVLATFGIGQIIPAYDIKKAFDLFCKMKPDFIMVDWMKETENGLDLTRRIRTDQRSPNPFVPIVMMTGFSQKKRVLMARDSGISEFLVKPYNVNTLYQKLEYLVEKPRMFVSAETYFGPDRRRKKEDGYRGPDRRSDEKPLIKTPSLKKAGSKTVN